MALDKWEDQIQKSYDLVPEYIKEDMLSSITWATDRLTDFDGSGHRIVVTASGDGLVCCSFAKPEWAGDHCGRGMETASEAIVMAVIEYLVQWNYI